MIFPVIAGLTRNPTDRRHDLARHCGLDPQSAYRQPLTKIGLTK